MLNCTGIHSVAKAPFFFFFLIPFQLFHVLFVSASFCLFIAVSQATVSLTNTNTSWKIFVMLLESDWFLGKWKLTEASWNMPDWAWFSTWHVEVVSQRLIVCPTLGNRHRKTHKDLLYVLFLVLYLECHRTGISVFWIELQSLKAAFLRGFSFSHQWTTASKQMYFQLNFLETAPVVNHISLNSLMIHRLSVSLLDKLLLDQCKRYYKTWITISITETAMIKEEYGLLSSVDRRDGSSFEKV